MRRYLALLLITFILMNGCKATNDHKTNLEKTELDRNDIEQEKDGEEKMPNEIVLFELLTYSELVEDYPHINNYYRNVLNKDIRDHRIFSENGVEIIAVSTGLKSSGGYRLEVVEIENIAGRTVINLEEHPPPEGALVTQVLVNPTIFIKLSKDKVYQDKMFYLNGKTFKRHGVSEY